MLRLKRVYVCDYCGSVEEPLFSTGGTEPRRGWIRLGKTCLCPTCSEAYKSARKAVSNEIVIYKTAPFKLKRVYICNSCGKVALPAVHSGDYTDIIRSLPMHWMELGRYDHSCHLCPECSDAYRKFLKARNNTKL